MVSQTQNYTQTQIKQIKNIVAKFGSDIDLDLNNFINRITIFDMLSEKEIKFISNLKVPFQSKDEIKLEDASLSQTSKSIMALAIAISISQKSLNPHYKNFIVYGKDSDGWRRPTDVKNWTLLQKAILEALPIDKDIPEFKSPQLKNIDTSMDTIPLEEYQIFASAVTEYLSQFQNSKVLGEYQYADINNDIINFTMPENRAVYAFPTYDFLQYKLPQAESVKKSDVFHHFDFSSSNYIYNETNNSLYISGDVKLHTSNFILQSYTDNFHSYFPQDGHYLSWKVIEPKNGLTMFEFYKLLWIKSIVSQLWNADLPQTTGAQKLAELLYIQAKDAIDEQKNDIDKKPRAEVEIQISDAMQKFLRTFNPSLGGTWGQTTITTITHAEFYEFILAVKQQSKIPPKIINWLSQSPNDPLYGQNEDTEKENSEFIHNLIKDMNLAQSLTSVTDTTTINKIRNLVSDEYSDFEIADIYSIKAPHKNDNYVSRFNLPVQHKTLIHGTKNSSILTILRDSLLTRAEIQHHQDAKASLTGLGLGDGIYFAQPYQAGKSLGYVYSQNDYVYLFIADVAYSKINNVSDWGNYDIADGDLVYAKGIGANSRDEFVAKESSQIELKYLLAIHK